MTDSLKIFYNSFGNEELYQLIRRKIATDMELITLNSDEDSERMEKIADCDVAIVAAAPLTKPVLEAARRLKLVHHQGVGYHDTVPTEALAARRISLALTPEGTVTPVAEHSVLLALGAARRAAFADAELRHGRWHVNSLRSVSTELLDKTIGFIGFGRIGQEASKRFHSFGMECIYFDPAVTAPEASPARAVSFDTLITSAHIISLHVPLTAKTKHLISAEVIAQMRQDAIIINTARGGLIDDSALANALASGHLLAAGLDVFETEPLPTESPFVGLPNVMLTPHISAGTRDAIGHKMTALCANLVRFQNGDSLNNEISLRDYL